MHKQPEYPLEPITAQQVKLAFTTATRNAGGMDGLLPAEAALFSDKACDWIVKLLNFIEDGAAWPEGQHKGRLAFLSKDENDPHNV